MKNLVYIGSPDRGKSNLAKQTLRDFQFNEDNTPRKNIIYDINKEYTVFPNELNKLFKKFPGIHEFSKCVADKEGVNVVFEEATAFFSNSGGIDLKTIDLLSRRTHTQNLNLLIFHSLRKLPLDILDFTDFLFLFRTEDMPDEVKKKFKSHKPLMERYLDVREKTNGTQFDRERKLYLPGSYKDDVTGELKHVTAEYSKKFFHYSRTWAR